jgi:hypothetical protein
MSKQVTIQTQYLPDHDITEFQTLPNGDKLLHIIVAEEVRKLQIFTREDGVSEVCIDLEANKSWLLPWVDNNPTIILEYPQ